MQNIILPSLHRTYHRACHRACVLVSCLAILLGHSVLMAAAEPVQLSIDIGHAQLNATQWSGLGEYSGEASGDGRSNHLISRRTPLLK